MKLKSISSYLYPILVVVGIILFIIALIFLASWVSKSIDVALEKEQKSATTTQSYAEASITTSSTQEVSSTTEVTSSTLQATRFENKSLISIEILNSTGITGKAAELSSLIEAMGYKVSNTGNATKREQTTLIKIKETSKAIFPSSVTEIEKIVNMGYKPQETTLETNSPYDVIIVIGMH